MNKDPFATLCSEASFLRQWLFDDALPVWADRGVDSTQGGFHEKLSQDGNVIDEPRRTRLVSRQIFVFATAAELGWRETTARALVDHGLDFLINKSVSADGPVYSVVAADGTPLRPEFDLYDHAFALFALGNAARLGYQRELVVTTGRRIRDAMVAGWKHPVAGFEEAMPPREPLNANQHMHLLEAFLAWEDAGEVHGWVQLSDETVGLAIASFIDPGTGAVREHYDHGWRPANGDIGRFVEPGHQFEWAWLLGRWGLARGRHRDMLSTVQRLAEIGETYGVNLATGLVANGVWEDLSMRDANSRLWPQTERLKAHLALADLADDLVDDLERERQLCLAAEASRGLRRYFSADFPGLWHETIDSEGRPVLDSARASSLYHIVCAIQELDRFVKRNSSNG